MYLESVSRPTLSQSLHTKRMACSLGYTVYNTYWPTHGITMLLHIALSTAYIVCILSQPQWDLAKAEKRFNSFLVTNFVLTPISGSNTSYSFLKLVVNVCCREIAWFYQTMRKHDFETVACIMQWLTNHHHLNGATLRHYSVTLSMIHKPTLRTALWDSSLSMSIAILTLGFHANTMH